jgi:Xaa-Pro aminopeptidase/Xaa-Pro dipeptidase
MLSVFSRRRKKILRLAKGADVIATKPQNVFYLTGFWGGAVAIIKPDKTLLVSSKMEAPRARKLSKESEVYEAPIRGSILIEVKRHLEKRRRIADSVEQGSYRRLFTEDEKPFLNARSIKDRGEIENIRKASKLLDYIFSIAERQLKPGRTEAQVASKLVAAAMLKGGMLPNSEDLLSPVIVASGGNGGYPHVELSDRVIRDGDLVVVYIFFRLDGYFSDSTRTFAVGSIGRQKKKAYAAVLEAQMEGLESCKEGEKCAEVHSKVVSVLKRHSLASFLPHGTGHGVGLNVHEMPWLSPGKDILSNGHVITVEPGVYFPGRFGVRIEDTAVVGKRLEVLTRYTKELVTVG